METSSRAAFRKRMANYLTYFLSDKWKKHFEEFPTIGIVCKTQNRLQTLLIDIEDQLNKFAKPQVEFKLTTFDQINTEGAGADIWKGAFGKNKLGALL